MAEYICIAVERICGGARGTHYPRVEGISIFRGSSPLSVSPSLIKPPLLPLPLALPFLSPFFFPRRKVNVQDGDETERERKKCEITDEYTRLKIIVISHFLSHLPQRGGLFIVKRDQNQNKKFLSLSENLFVVFVKKIFPKKRIIKIKGKKKNSNDLPKNPTPFNYTILRYSTYEDRENKICIPAGMRGIKGETSDK